MRKKLRLIAAVAVMLSLLGPAAPAYAANGDTYRLVNRLWSNQCLDSNANGDAYFLPCTSNNNYQRWRIWFGGWVVNTATGRCLTLMSNWDVRTTPCDPAQRDPHQMWQQWHGGWIRNPTFGACVRAYWNNDIAAEPCNQADWAEHWYQRVF